MNQGSQFGEQSKINIFLKTSQDIQAAQKI